MNQRTRRIAAYAVLYLVWGSTYLAMRIAVESLPPFSLAAMRFICSGLILAGWALARGAAWPTRAEVLAAFPVGLLLFLGGNASVLWAVQRVPSGVAALIVALTPLWLALLQGTRPSRQTVVGIALGLAGVALLVWPTNMPESTHNAGIDPIGIGVLVMASMFWAAGSLVQRRARHASPLLGNGLEMLAGAALLAAVGAAMGEVQDARMIAQGSAQSWAALAYLTIFGSLLGFTSYAWLMRHDDPARVATYAYVNPVVAVFLGAYLADEKLSQRTVAAAAVIIAGVFVIVTAKSSAQVGGRPQRADVDRQ